MEHLRGGATGIRQHYSPDRIFRFIEPPQSTSSSPPVELSEYEIFSTSSGGSSPSQTLRRIPNRTISGILAALADNNNNASLNPESRHIFNHKAAITSSSSSSSTSPLLIAVPKKTERVRMFHQSAPVNVPVIPAVLQRRAMELEEIVSEDELEGVEDWRIVPPHVMVDSRPSRILSCSVLEGAGRTLKGRDLRQVRNAIWQRTGFID